MPARTYWLDLFTGTTWQQFLDAGANVSGFRENRSKAVQKIKPGDYLLCYLTGVSRFIGVLEVTSESFMDTTAIWGEAAFPCRVHVKPIVILAPETAVPIHELKESLSIFQDLKSPHAWTGHLRGSPARWSTKDGEIILAALQEAAANPVERPVNPAKLARRPRGLETKIGPVTVPEAEEPESVQPPTSTEPSDHTEIQYLLLKLGSEMGFSVWVARNDRSRLYNGKKLSELFKFKESLPLQFDEATTRTIELIDVLWLRGNAIVSAFEVESTTLIYSGLLRMSDLIAMQPNLSIPLYIVAPDERREKVIMEVNRPTFSRLTPPLVALCRFIGFSALRQRLQEVGPFIRYLRQEFLEELSEECTLEQA
jgi:predicted RNA-binding protein